MANICELCGKKSVVARKYKKLISRYNPSPKMRKKPNLQWATLSSGQRIKVCTRCKRTLAKKANV